MEDSISQNLKEKLQASIPLGNAVALHHRPFANKIEVRERERERKLVNFSKKLEIYIVLRVSYTQS